MIEFDELLPIWLRTDRKPASIESRPANTPDTPEWPAGAVERVTYHREEYPDTPIGIQFPRVTHLGADGWPIETPPELKPFLDPALKAVFRRSPLGALLGGCWSSWRRTCCHKTYEEWVDEIRNDRRDESAETTDAVLALLSGGVAVDDEDLLTF